MENNLPLNTGTTAITKPDTKHVKLIVNAIFRLLPPAANLGANPLAKVSMTIINTIIQEVKARF